MMRKALVLIGGLVFLGLAGVGGHRLWVNATTIKLDAPASIGLNLCSDTAARDGKTVTIAIGDSLTRGNMSHNYLADARERLGDGHLILNAGINGNKVYHVEQRLDEVIACEPDIVTLMIGTNDAIFPETLDDSWSTVTQGLDRVLTRLSEDTDATIALFTLPLLGEDLDQTLNQRAEDVSARLETVALAHGVEVLSLRAAHLARLNNEPPRPWPLCNSMDDVLEEIKHTRPHVVRRGRVVDYDALAAQQGHLLVIDCVHLSRQGAAPVTDLLVDFVEARSAP